MKSSLLLPNQFKKIGVLLFPLGLIIWILTQQGTIDLSYNHSLKVIVLVVSFFSFLFGLYCSLFSREPVEDEYINSVRLKSFQISSITQMIYFLITFTLMFLLKIEPNGDGGLVIYLLSSIVLYWIMYLLIFNFTLIMNKTKLND